MTRKVTDRVAGETQTKYHTSDITITVIVNNIKILDTYITCVINKAYIKTTIELDALSQMTTSYMNTDESLQYQGKTYRERKKNI